MSSWWSPNPCDKARMAFPNRFRGPLCFYVVADRLSGQSG